MTFENFCVWLLQDVRMGPGDRGHGRGSDKGAGGGELLPRWGGGLQVCILCMGGGMGGVVSEVVEP